MGSFLLTATNEVTFSTNSPTAAQIEGALQAIPLVAARASRAAHGLPDYGGWVGSPRIVRRANALPPGGRLTDIAWLYSWPDSSSVTAQTVADYIRSTAGGTGADVGSVAIALPASDGWRDVRIIPYNPAVNGSVEWWSSGAASQTITKDAFDLNQQTGSNRSVENVLGPVSIRPPDLANPLGPLMDLVPWVVGGLVVVYVVGPLLQAMLPKARANPGPVVPPRTVHRVWKAVEDAAKADRSKVAHAFSRNRLLAALSWNDPDGEYDRLDQDTLADALVYQVNGSDPSQAERLAKEEAAANRGHRKNPRAKFPHEDIFDAVQAAPKSKRLEVARAYSRHALISALQHNDQNGSYTDSQARAEGRSPLSREEAAELVVEQVANSMDSA